MFVCKTCFIALHEVLAQCEPVISHILGPNRWEIVSSFKDKCIAEVDMEVFMHAIELAVCPDPVTGIMPPPPPAHDPLPNLFGGEPSPTPAPAPNPVVVAPGGEIPGMGKVTPIAPDGVKHQEEIDVGGEVEVFSFVAKAGESYEMDSDLETLPDSVMELLDIDGKTILVENDDDPRVTDLYDSYIEWTCPRDGTYFINVHEYGRDIGTFALTITTAKEGLFGIGGEQQHRGIGPGRSDRIHGGEQGVLVRAVNLSHDRVTLGSGRNLPGGFNHGASILCRGRLPRRLGRGAERFDSPPKSVTINRRDGGGFIVSHQIFD